jgi:hypothetical protein
LSDYEAFAANFGEAAWANYERTQPPDLLHSTLHEQLNLLLRNDFWVIQHLFTCSDERIKTM